ncbi:chemotaxis-specific protein-glutamate methyltransferase CheB [Sphingomonas canadensis]|uniref:Protein-glutamate methylesterase/protein-glutamine glutaminase n=1 Tax=Sphingomonas canadensis TaxID=1219257 RepID=A0ABW3H2K6_9SPHN|nr:chemotaxis-specific protein-glutamate methyltransferase CheB [Sphingomonas canadensis]MCW3834733.1 chemotaxis-specific protein-glutamate methyltransferase CheB [Sphingomonas canadensis]
MKPIRVLVVEDSRTVRERLVEVLDADPQFEVVGSAGDGGEAIERCRELRPDVMTLDMMLPVMTGLAVTEYVMAHFPTPILIVSSSINRGELYRTYDALAAGAVDAFDKASSFDDDGGEWERRFLAAVRMVSRIKVITHPRARMAPLARRVPEQAAEAVPAVPAPRGPAVSVVAIGASTGGPAAVTEVLRALPEGFPLPVLLVIHIGQPFGSNFADWLDGQTCHRVHFARDGEPLGRRGRVVMAPPDRHLVVEGGILRLHAGPERHSCRPSVDILFESVALSFGASAAACLLTGMGRDGAAGLLRIRQAGGLTIAQDEATSVVYGMPREAAQIGAAQRVLPLRAIGPAIAAAANAIQGVKTR